MELDETKIDCSERRENVFCIYRIVPGKRKKGPPIILKEKEVVIGRHPEAQLVIPSENVSRKHAVLSRTSDSYDIQDAKSLNGVWVNKEQLTPLVPRLLVSGDVFSLGNPEETKHIFLFSRHSGTGRDDSPTPKMAKKESLEQELLNKEVEERIQRLQQELEEKKEVERKLQEKIQAQQKQHQENLEQERERILRERQEAETRLRQELQVQLEGEEHALQEQRRTLLAEKERVEQELRQKMTQEMQEALLKEQQRLNQELEQKSEQAQKLEEQLVQSRALQTQSRSEMMHHFGDLLETELNCSICAELFTQAYTLGCSHTFCKHCITAWKKKKNECPICRAKIKSMVHALVLDNFIEQMVRNLSPDLKRNRLKLLKERGLSCTQLEKELQDCPTSDSRIPTPAYSSKTGSNPFQVNILPTPTTSSGSSSGAGTASVTLRQPSILLRPVNGTSMPLGFQALFESAVSGAGNTFRLVTVGGQSTLQRVSLPTQTTTTVASNITNTRPSVLRHSTLTTVIRPDLHQPRRAAGQQVAAAGRGAVPRNTTRGRVPTAAVAGGSVRQSARTGAPRWSPADASVQAATAAETGSLNPSFSEAESANIVLPPAAQFIEADVSVTGAAETGILVPNSSRADNATVEDLFFPPVAQFVEVGATEHSSAAHSSPSINNMNSETEIGANRMPSQSTPGVVQTESEAINISSSAESHSAIEISDSEEDFSSHSDDDDQSEEDSDDYSDYEPRYVRGAYYGGYGRCFNCGERGHWANGCRY